jgi:hypothetical protein
MIGFTLLQTGNVFGNKKITCFSWSCDNKIGEIVKTRRWKENKKRQFFQKRCKELVI